MLLPVVCAICGRAGASPCRPCVAALRRAPPSPPPPGVDACAALLAYDGPARDLVARLKYRNARGSLAWLAGGMAPLVRRWPVDVVTWAPTTPDRRRARGFDQAELLARRVASAIGRPCRPLLRRVAGPPQTGRSGAERWDGPRMVAATGPARSPPGVVLVVDDVITTGASLAAAARALREAGAGSVLGLAAARTPGPGACH